MQVHIVLGAGFALTALAACGKDESPPAPSAPAAAKIEGAAWIGTAVDPSRPARKVRALAFFKPT